MSAGPAVPRLCGDLARWGEAAGLHWCDIDLDGKTAVISQQF